jgi:hypothetical protein
MADLIVKVTGNGNNVKLVATVDNILAIQVAASGVIEIAPGNPWGGIVSPNGLGGTYWDGEAPDHKTGWDFNGIAFKLGGNVVAARAVLSTGELATVVVEQ